MNKLLSLAIFVLGLNAISAFALDAVEPTANGHFKISGNWSSLLRGRNTLELQIFDENNQGLSQATVVVDYNMEDMDMSPPATAVNEANGGLYTKTVQMGMRGNWDYDVTITKNGLTDSLHKIVNAH